MVGYSSPSKSSSSSGTMTNLPWRDIRSLMGRAEKRYVEPLLTGDWSAPGVQDVMNLARGETTKATSELMGKLARETGLSSPAKAKMMSDAMSKISELATGTGIKTIQELKAWFEKVTGQMGQFGLSSSSGGGGASIGGSSGVTATVKGG